jgi:hypothetical protein
MKYSHLLPLCICNLYSNREKSGSHSMLLSYLTHTSVNNHFINQSPVLMYKALQTPLTPSAT